MTNGDNLLQFLKIDVEWLDIETCNHRIFSTMATLYTYCFRDVRTYRHFIVARWFSFLCKDQVRLKDWGGKVIFRFKVTDVLDK